MPCPSQRKARTGIQSLIRREPLSGDLASKQLWVPQTSAGFGCVGGGHCPSCLIRALPLLTSPAATANSPPTRGRLAPRRRGSAWIRRCWKWRPRGEAGGSGDVPAKPRQLATASGTGPLMTPPSRVIRPLRPCFSGSITGFFVVSMLDAFEHLDGRSAHAQSVQRAILVSHQFQDRDRRVQSRHAEVNGQGADILVPHRNDAGADQHAGVVGEGKAGERGDSFRQIAGNPQRQPVESARSSISAKAAAAEKVPKTASVHAPTDMGLCGLKTRIIARKRAGRPEIGDQQCAGDRRSSRGDVTAIARQLAIAAQSSARPRR